MLSLYYSMYVTVYLDFRFYFVPGSMKVCEFSENSSLAPFHSETDLRRVSGALSERSVLHPGPRTVFGTLSEIWGPWRDSS